MLKIHEAPDKATVFFSFSFHRRPLHQPLLSQSRLEGPAMKDHSTLRKGEEEEDKGSATFKVCSQ